MTTSRTVVVSLPSGAGVVRLDRGLLVTDEVGDGGGTFLNEDDPFQPVKTWVDENCSVVGGLLPPGAVGAEAVDDRGRRVAAVVGGGAYAVMLEQPHDGHEPIVCCRDASGAPVRRPWAADYPSVCVTDATEPCPLAAQSTGTSTRPMRSGAADGAATGGARWPDASYAAITLWLRARDRESRAAALGATQSEPLITIDGGPPGA